MLRNRLEIGHMTRLTFLKTRFARYKKVKLFKCPISRHILATKQKFRL